MSGSHSLWKRVLGGVLGLAVMAGLLLFARSRGTTGEEIQGWEQAIVIAAAAAGLVAVIVMRRMR